jgi:hypothetical protein
LISSRLEIPSNQFQDEGRKKFMKSHVVAAQLGQTERELQGVEAGVEVQRAARAARAERWGAAERAER